MDGASVEQTRGTSVTLVKTAHQSSRGLRGDEHGLVYMPQVSEATIHVSCISYMDVFSSELIFLFVWHR